MDALIAVMFKVAFTIFLSGIIAFFAVMIATVWKIAP